MAAITAIRAITRQSKGYMNGKNIVQCLPNVVWFYIIGINDLEGRVGI